MGSESKGLSSSSSSLSSSLSPSTKKIVQNLKEIVNCPETEIYDVLKDCNMDPNEAVQRLLTQDTFHEVKSKRERRKEMKETQDTRARVGYNNSSGRGTRASGSTNSSYKIEKMLAVASSPAPPSTFNSGSLNTDTTVTVQSIRRGDVISSSAQPSQPVSGHLSLADIVRMGRPTSKGPHDLHSQTATNESDFTVCQNSFLDDWAVVEQPSDADSHEVKAPERNLSNGDLSSDYLVTASVSSGGDKSNAVGTSRCDDSEPGSVSNFSDPDLSNDVVAMSSTVVLPSHLQALAADCSHLSFGTFKSGSNSVSIGPLPSDGEASTTKDVLSSWPLETRNIGCATDDSLESNHNFAPSFVEGLDKLDVSGDSNVENIGRSAAELSFARTDPTFENQSFQSRPGFVESPSSGVLMSNFKSLRGSESLQAQFLANQSIPLRHGNTVSSLSSTSDSFAEWRQPPPDAFSRSLMSSNAPNRHRGEPSYSEPNLPFERSSNNGMSYPGLLQSYTKLPSTFQQQLYLSRDNFHQSTADNLRRLSHHGGSVSRFPGDFGTTGFYENYGNAPGSYPYGPPSPMVANSGYNGGFNPRYSDLERELLTSLQQNLSSPTRNHSFSSRMQPSAQDIEYYSLLGQKQQFAGNGQVQQQQSQSRGTLGYFGYRSQPETPQDLHLQNSDSSTVGTQYLLSQQFVRH